MQVQVTINPRKCMATQNCTAIAPHVFELGAAGYSRVKTSEFTEEDLEVLQEAAGACPNIAITVEVVEG
jgi:ferredoxin